MTETDLSTLDKPDGAIRKLDAEPSPILELIRVAAANPTPDTVAVVKEMKLLYLDEMARQAEQEYNDAFARFQNECPKIAKTRSSKKTTAPGGSFGYMFANLEDILSAVIPILAKHGLSLSFGRADSSKPDLYRVTGTLRHRRGHKFSDWYEGPLDTGTMSKVQSLGSTDSYYRRYLACAMLGIVASDEDNDGAPPEEIEKITNAEVKQLRALIEKSGADLDKFLKWVLHSTPDGERFIADIPSSKHVECVAQLQGRIKALQAKMKPTGEYVEEAKPE